MQSNTQARTVACTPPPRAAAATGAMQSAMMSSSSESRRSSRWRRRRRQRVACVLSTVALALACSWQQRGAAGDPYYDDGYGTGGSGSNATGYEHYYDSSSLRRAHTSSALHQPELAAWLITPSSRASQRAALWLGAQLCTWARSRVSARSHTGTPACALAPLTLAVRTSTPTRGASQQRLRAQHQGTRAPRQQRQTRTMTMATCLRRRTPTLSGEGCRSSSCYTWRRRRGACEGRRACSTRARCSYAALAMRTT